MGYTDRRVIHRNCLLRRNEQKSTQFRQVHVADSVNEQISTSDSQFTGVSINPRGAPTARRNEQKSTWNVFKDLRMCHTARMNEQKSTWGRQIRGFHTGTVHRAGMNKNRDLILACRVHPRCKRVATAGRFSKGRIFCRVTKSIMRRTFCCFRPTVPARIRLEIVHTICLCLYSELPLLSHATAFCGFHSRMPNMIAFQCWLYACFLCLWS